MESNIGQNASQELATGSQCSAGKVSWRDKPAATVLSKVFAWASLVLSFSGLILYCSVSGKGVGEVFKYIIGAWTGIVVLPLGILGRICSKDRIIKWIAIGGIVLGAIVLLLAIASLINLIAAENNSGYR